jgi:hypothetical protein
MKGIDGLGLGDTGDRPYRGPHTKRKSEYGKELCVLVERSAKTRHEER